MNSKNPKDPMDPPPFPEDATIIIDPEDTELGGDPQGYDVRPRDEPSVTDSMSDSGEFVVLLPEGEEGAGTAQAMGAMGITDSGDEWGTAETMRLDGAGGATGQFGSVTEFLDSDDPFVAGATETYEQHDLSGPMSGSGGATEEVRLLLSTPGFGDPEATLAMDGQPAFADSDEEITGLPDLENVEDITALLDDVRTGELSAPDAGFDSDMGLDSVAHHRAGGGLPMGKLLAAAAVLALAVVGYFYGPGLYESTFGGSTEVVKRDPVDTSGGGSDSPVVTTTTGGETTTGVDQVPQVESIYRTWLVKSLVHNFNAK